MTKAIALLAFLLVPMFNSQNLAGQPSSSQPVQQQNQPAKQTPPGNQEKARPGKPEPNEALGQTEQAELELQRALQESGNDRAALVRNLEDYLRRFPEAPRRAAVYRALVETSLQLRDNSRALDYTERLVAIQPDDSAMMLLAVDLLERAGDDQSLTRAVGYATRVLDRAEKSLEQKPPRVSLAEWELEQRRLQMSVYVIRGRLEMSRRRYTEAVADLEKAYQILPNAPAAMRLGEIAEVRKDYPQAIEHFLVAFAMPEEESQVDRAAVRRKLGNVWRIVHGSDAGLGDRILATYDRLLAQSTEGATPQRNAGLRDPFAFVVRRADGSELKLAEQKGRVLVLNFWATWCLPCRELEPLFDRVFDEFRERSDVTFLAVNGDEDEDLVRPYLERHKLRVPVVFADGLDSVMKIRSIPTVIVLDREGHLVYRSEGFEPEGFIEALSRAITRALGGERK
jgi:thiol-disulfide isomerase/thioredoxin